MSWLRRSGWVVLVAWAAGCEPMPSGGSLFAPVREDLAPAVAGEGEPAGGFDFEGEDRPAEDTDAKVEQAEVENETPLSPAEMMQGMGIGADGKGGEAVAAPAPAPVLVSGPPAGSWGVRLLSTVADAQPPRAILGFADGTETVVTPGTMLPAAHVVVLAIGRDAIQIADVTPEGDHAKVQTQTLTALVPNK
jgi:hypothetical protein